MFDVQNASLVAGGEGVPLKPVELEGLYVVPSIATISSQITGAGATTLVARHEGGRARVFGKVRDYIGAETTVISEANYLVSGQAVWFSLVCVQHRNAGQVSLIWVPGTVAALADVVKPTFAQVQSFLGLDAKESTFGYCGSTRFTRVSDVVIDVATSDFARPAYTDESNKVELISAVDDKSTLLAVPAGHLDFACDLTSCSAVVAGSLYIDGAKLPDFPYGGRIDSMEYIPAVAPAGVAADIDLLPGIDGTACTGGLLTLLLATAAIPTPKLSTAVTALNDFDIGATLDIEVDEKTTSFTAGSGTLRVHISEYIPK